MSIEVTVGKALESHRDKPLVFLDPGVGIKANEEYVKPWQTIADVVAKHAYWVQHVTDGEYELILSGYGSHSPLHLMPTVDYVLRNSDAAILNCDSPLLASKVPLEIKTRIILDGRLSSQNGYSIARDEREALSLLFQNPKIANSFRRDTGFSRYVKDNYKAKLTTSLQYNVRPLLSGTAGILAGGAGYAILGTFVNPYLGLAAGFFFFLGTIDKVNSSIKTSLANALTTYYLDQNGK